MKSPGWREDHEQIMKADRANQKTNKTKQMPDIDSYLDYEDKILTFEVWSTSPRRMAATMFRCV